MTTGVDAMDEYDPEWDAIPQKPKNHNHVQLTPERVEECISKVTAGVTQVMERLSRNSMRLAYMMSNDIDIYERFENFHTMSKEELQQFWTDVHTRYEAIHSTTPKEG